MTDNNYTELKGKIDAYRTRELNGERLPYEESKHYIDLKRELFRVESKGRLQRIIMANKTRIEGKRWIKKRLS